MTPHLVTAFTAPTTAPEPPRIARELRVAPWPDPVVERTGLDPRSRYVESFWLPILGPSTILLFRRLAQRLERSPEGFTMSGDEMARSLGLAGIGGRHSPFRRAIERGARHGFCRVRPEALLVRTKVGALSRQQVARLHPELQALHRCWEADPADWARREIVAAAQADGSELLAMGHDPAGAEAVLGAAGTHPALASWATRSRPTQPAAGDPVPSDSRRASSVRTPNPVAPLAR
jgi:hypothetical protein